MFNLYFHHPPIHHSVLDFVVWLVLLQHFPVVWLCLCSPLIQLSHNACLESLCIKFMSSVCCTAEQNPEWLCCTPAVKFVFCLCHRVKPLFCSLLHLYVCASTHPFIDDILDILATCSTSIFLLNHSPDITIVICQGFSRWVLCH